MDLQQFDSTLKSALENIEVPYEPATWAALESRLETLNAPDALDKMLRPTLERMESAYDAGTWTMLANRMDALTRVRSLRVHKMVEAAILLLLLVNLKGFFGMVESVTNPAPQKQIAPGPIAGAHHNKNKKHNSNSAIADATTNSTIGEELMHLVQSIAGTNETGTSDNTTQAPLAETNTSVLSSATFYGQSGPMQLPATIMLRGKSAQPLLYASSNLLQIPSLNLPSPSKKSPFYGATYASYDQHYVREGDYSARSKGYGGGLRVGYRKGKWGVEGGVQYANVQYAPKSKGELYENVPQVSSSFYYIDQVDADVFSVPVRATRRLAKTGKTSAHALAGVTAGFASSKNYEYHTKQLPGIGSSNQLNTKPLPNAKGVLENGGLAQNAYLTADVGLRVEQGIGKRYVAFVEPVYRQTLAGGLGPNTARLNTFSIQAGIMASL